MKVMKFGGSSVADSEMIKKVGSIVAAACAKDRCAVVLSAMKGVTDSLLIMADLAHREQSEYQTKFDELHSNMQQTIANLLPPDDRQTCTEAVERILGELKDLLNGIALVKECSSRSLDLTASFGERLSCLVFTHYFSHTFSPAEMIDAREIIITDDTFGSASVEYEKTYANIYKRLHNTDTLPIITGFIASTENGYTTTLGRNGSDFSASIIGAGLRADKIEIWTDVDGVLSADPGIVSTVFVLPEISYQEAMELSYFGAKVIHPNTMIPAVDYNIPIMIKNTLNPDAPGTCISSTKRTDKHTITGIASIDRVSLINIEGSGMIGVIGTASRVFKALANAKVNVIMISQASSEHSICIVCKEQEAQHALQALEQELFDELKTKRIQQFELINNLEIIAVIGENMRGTPGISGKLFSALGSKGINILAIAQGSSERNISFVIQKSDVTVALNTIHRTFLEES